MKLKRNLFSIVLFGIVFFGLFFGFNKDIAWGVNITARCCVDFENQECRLKPADGACQPFHFDYSEGNNVGEKEFSCDISAQCREAFDAVFDCSRYGGSFAECGTKPAGCFWASADYGTGSRCMSILNLECSKLSKIDCEKSVSCKYDSAGGKCNNAASVDAYVADYYSNVKGTDLMPVCAIRGDCADVNDILLVFINYLSRRFIGLLFQLLSELFQGNKCMNLA